MTETKIHFLPQAAETPSGWQIWLATRVAALFALMLGPELFEE